MKKLMTLATTAVVAAGSALAEGTAPAPYVPDGSAITGGNIEYVTGTGGILEMIANYIDAVADKAWPVILGIVGIGLLLWLGRAMIRAVRAYFSTSM